MSLYSPKQDNEKEIKMDPSRFPKKCTLSKSAQNLTKEKVYVAGYFREKTKLSDCKSVKSFCFRGELRNGWIFLRGEKTVNFRSRKKSTCKKIKFTVIEEKVFRSVKIPFTGKMKNGRSANIAAMFLKKMI